jgi:hypothetical protein
VLEATPEAEVSSVEVEAVDDDELLLQPEDNANPNPAAIIAAFKLIFFIK